MLLYAVEPLNESEMQQLVLNVAKKLRKQHRGDIQHLKKHFELADEILQGSSLEDQVSELLKLWAKQSDSNDREKLNTCLRSANMSTLTL